jgi:hypothetical protein
MTRGARENRETAHERAADAEDVDVHEEAAKTRAWR